MLKPLSEARWNFSTAAHLLNRAGFGGPPAEIERLVRLGPERAVAALLDYEKIPDPTPDPVWAKPDPDRRAKFEALRRASKEERDHLLREERRTQLQRMIELRGWWLQRMAQGPRPLQEKMVLFWHGHFATSFEKVRDAYLMWRQNELFRRLATGNWLQLLVEVAKDPAMLLWLDQAQSRKQHPNENFARELMELFALSEGHYTEKDVTEAARALTGWSYDRVEQKFVERPALHDEGVKTVLGKTGNLNGYDVLQQIVAQPQAARFITAKLWHFFAGQPPSPKLNEALAAVFRQHGNQFKPLLRVLFRSEAFYEPALLRGQVKSPVQWLVGTVRMLEMDLPPAPVCTAILRLLGQDLFAPPNVKGWDGGLSWITTNTLLMRYNLAAALVSGDWSALASAGARTATPSARRFENRLRQFRAGGPDLNRLFTESERRDKDAFLAAIEKRLLQSELKEKQKTALRQYLDSQGELDEGDLRAAIRLVLCTPEYQMT